LSKYVKTSASSLLLEHDGTQSSELLLLFLWVGFPKSSPLMLHLLDCLHIQDVKEEEVLGTDKA
jgi:hypothetical protein